MALDRVFIGQLDNGRIENPEAAAHVRKVLRLRNGDKFAGYDGENGYELELLGGSGEGLVVKVLSRRELPGTAADIVLAPSLLKGHRWEILLEKAVELGAAAVRPVSSERCVVKLKGKDVSSKVARWKKIMEAACAQCAGRLPELEPPVSFGDVLQGAAGAPNRFILSGEGAATPASELLEQAVPGQVIILVGPEGDWTEDELLMADEAGFKRMSLGARILRSETAGVAALAVAASHLNKKQGF